MGMMSHYSPESNASRRVVSPTGSLSQPSCFHFEQEIERDRDWFFSPDRKTIQTIYLRERGEDVSLPQVLRDEASSSRHLDTSTTITQMCVWMCVLLLDWFPRQWRSQSGGEEWSSLPKSNLTHLGRGSTRTENPDRNTSGVHVCIQFVSMCLHVCRYEWVQTCTWAWFCMCTCF